MKRSLLLLAFLIACLNLTFAQSPNGFKYQAVARNSSGAQLSNQNISFRISILKGSTNASIVYSEEHKTTTNDLGLVNLEIGNGTVLNGTFSTINWGNDSYFVRVELDEQGGSNYTEMGTSQLLAVPYALHANTVQNDSVEDADADPSNEIQNLILSGTDLSISDGNTVDLSMLEDADADPSNEIQNLTLSGTDLSISDGNTVDLVGLKSLNYWKKNLSNIFYESGKQSIGDKADTFAVLNVTNKETFISPNKNTAIADFQRKYHNSNARFIIYGYPDTENVYSHMRRSVMLYATSDAKNLILCASQDEGTIQFYTKSWIYPSSERMRIASNGNIGIANSDPRSKLHVTDGDVYIENVNRGVIMKSPSGQCWRMTVSDSGSPVFTAVPCP